MWKQQLRTASFRKVRFNLTNAEASFGRRTANHSFPKRDEPYTEDMGRKAREFTIEAFIIGDDYLRLKKRLIEACEKPGPGRLVHPYYGKKNVVCTSCVVKENSGEGGIARFDLTFREAGSLRFPSNGRDRKGLLSLVGLDAADKALNDFTDQFSVASQPQDLVDTASNKVEEFTEALDRSTNFITRNSDEIADLAFSIKDLQNDVDTIVHTPEVLGSRIQNSLALVRDAVTNPRESGKVYYGLFSFGSSDTHSTRQTVTRQQQVSNLKALNNLIIVSALSYAALDLADMEFTSIEEAELFRDKFFSAIDNQMEQEETSDDMYQALDALKVQIGKATPLENESLPNVVSITPQETRPSLVIAYELYGNLSLEQDIIDRNDVRHPGFVPGGKALKVLSNG